MTLRLLRIRFKGEIMPISASNGVSAALSQVNAQEQRSVLVLKKALDAQAQTAAALIQALPQPVAIDNLPPNLGRNVNTSA